MPKTDSTLLIKRFVVFLVGVPGYILTIVPWLFVLTLVAIAVNNYSARGMVSLQLDSVTAQSSLLLTSADIVPLLLITSGLWLFFAWMTKHILLIIARFITDTEKGQLLTKYFALVVGWLAVLVVAWLIFKNVQLGFLKSELLTIVIGTISFSLEYAFSKLLKVVY